MYNTKTVWTLYFIYLNIITLSEAESSKHVKVSSLTVPFHPLHSAVMSQQQQQQDSVSGFPCGAATPQSPLLSPMMAQGQSPMLQQQNQGQAQPQGAASGYQASADLGGWPQPANISTSSR